jgi:putative sterol carrier protein
MTDATTRFFEVLGRRRHEPLLARGGGTARFDVTNNGDMEHFLVRIDKGDIQVSREVEPADCVIRTDRDQLGDLVTGKVNAMAELLRGALVIEGDPELLVLVQRLFTGRSNQDADADADADGEGSRR